MCVSGLWPKTLKRAMTGTTMTRPSSTRRTQMSCCRTSRSRSRLRTMPPGTSAMRRGSGRRLAFLLGVGPGDEPAAGDDERAHDDEYDQERVAPAAAAVRYDHVLRRRRRDGVLVERPAVPVRIRVGEEGLELVGPDEPEARADQTAQQLRCGDWPLPDRGRPRGRPRGAKQANDRSRPGVDVELRLATALGVHLEAQRLSVSEQAGGLHRLPRRARAARPRPPAAPRSGAVASGRAPR